MGITHRRSHDFSKGGSHCVKVRVLVCLEIFKLKRDGIFATCSRLFGEKRLEKGGATGTPGPPLATPLLQYVVASISTRDATKVNFSATRSICGR